MNKYFEYRKHKTNFKTGTAGVTTFLHAEYMFLNLLSARISGAEKGFLDFGAVFTATILATALACFAMAFYGKTWPIGLGLVWV